MNPNYVMTCMAVVTGLVGLGFIIFPTQITNQVFPTIGEEAIMKRFLFASGICFLLNALMLIKVSVIDGVTTFPFPLFVFLVILSGTAFYVSNKKKAKDELIKEI